MKRTGGAGVLSSGIHGSTIRRTDEFTLVIAPRGGFLLPADASLDALPRPLVDPGRMLLATDILFRDVTTRPFATGQSTRSVGFTAETLTILDGRPQEVAFRFDEPVDSQRWRWLVWKDGLYVPFELPSVGGEAVIAPYFFSLR